MTALGGVIMAPELNNFRKSEQWLLMHMGSAAISKTTSLPDGNNHPNTWRMPLKAGAISSRNRINGSGDVFGTRTYGVAILANLYASGGISSALHSIGIAILANLSGDGGVTFASGGQGKTITANISGTGDITQAIVSLLVQIYAAISGSGTISQADLKAYLNALADLTGSGTITSADLEGLGELIAVLYGEGLIDPLLVATGELGAVIKSYSDLSTEGLRDAIWQAAAANYQDPTTMGGKLNLASSGGVDYEALADAVWQALKGDYTDVTQMGGVINILQTKLDELHKIQGLDADNPMTITPTLRTAGNIDIELSGDGENLVIATRQ